MISCVPWTSSRHCRLLYASSYRKASQADSRGAGVYSHSQHHPLRFEAREHSHLRHEQVRIWRNRHLERSSSLSILADPTLPPISSSRRPIRSTSSRVPTELRRSFWGSILTNELTFGRWGCIAAELFTHSLLFDNYSVGTLAYFNFLHYWRSAACIVAGSGLSSS